MRHSMNLKSIVLVTVAVLFVLVVALSSIGAFSYTPTPKGTEVSTLTTARYGTVLVAGRSDHLLNNFPLYEFSGDVSEHFGCGTTKEEGYDLGANVKVSLACTGPQRDLLDDVSSDDWPALTSKVTPVAGPGVDQRLLGRIYRRGLGYQVTYGGHPLYLFDQSSKPFAPQGEGYVETVSPLPPWHGYWYLVNAASGAPAASEAIIKPATLPSGKRVMAAVMDENASPLAIAVYQSTSTSTVTRCDVRCRVAWIPVYSTARPVVHGYDASLFGLRRVANGASAVTYRGSLLYVYGREKVLLATHARLKANGTSGNGAGEVGPNGSMHTVGNSP
ncbi:MAG: hypothetical protein ABI298_02790 [Acidimicrobiales bacterium]